MTRSTCIVVLAALAALLASGCHHSSLVSAAPAPLPGSPHPAYSITDIGPGWPSGCNNKEQVVGLSPTAEPNIGFRGFLWSKSQRTEIPTLGGRFSDAENISDQSQIIGGAAVPNLTPQGIPETHTCLWQDGKLTDLEADVRFRGASRLHLTAIGGLYVVSGSQGRQKQKHLWFYPGGFGPGKGQDLGIIGGDNVRVAAISDSGLVVGCKGKDSRFFPERAFLWQKGRMTDLGTLGGKISEATAINNRGQVVGNSDLTGSPGFDPFGLHTHAFLWEHGKMHDLGTLPNGISSHADAINDSGEIVGYSTDKPTPLKPDLASEPTLWKNGRITALSALIPAGTQWWRIDEARDINEKGEIIGSGSIRSDGQGHGYLLTPIGYNSGKGDNTNGRHESSAAA